MRAGNTYRGSRRNEARSLGLIWRTLDNVVDGNGTRVVKYPFERLGSRIVKEAARGE
jgi:hypothetical protein